MLHVHSSQHKHAVALSNFVRVVVSFSFFMSAFEHWMFYVKANCNTQHRIWCGPATCSTVVGTCNHTVVWWDSLLAYHDAIQTHLSNCIMFLDYVSAAAVQPLLAALLHIIGALALTANNSNFHSSFLLFTSVLAGSCRCSLAW
jgi:hypothetical protein